MSWDPPTIDEAAHSVGSLALAGLQAAALVARTALVAAESGGDYRERVGDLILLQLDALDAAIDQYRLAAADERERSRLF